MGKQGKPRKTKENPKKKECKGSFVSSSSSEEEEEEDADPLLGTV